VPYCHNQLTDVHNLSATISQLCSKLPESLPKGLQVLLVHGIQQTLRIVIAVMVVASWERIPKLKDDAVKINNKWVAVNAAEGGPVGELGVPMHVLC
jgi:hypothetical protein